MFGGYWSLLLLYDDSPYAERVDRVLEHAGQAGLACAAFEKGIEGRADGGLVGDAELGQVVEGGVVVINWFVGVFKVEGGHVVGWARACLSKWCLVLL